MARIRKADAGGRREHEMIWRVGKYIRLSREDGNVISESVVNQNQILSDEIPAFFADTPYEVTDTYIDDGTSGTTDMERQDFQRMVEDVKCGRINCIIVKNLSRAFRNSANQGRFLEEFIPLYNTRFISLYQPRIDTFLDPEIVHSLEVGITGFMNEQYAYKTSADVRRTFRHKREKGEFIGAFAPYGYAKDPDNKNALVIDLDAAQVVRDIFSWFVSQGMSKAGIARRLNAYGIPNPAAYKRSKGLRYRNPHCTHNDGLWSPSTVARMLQNPLYIGVMRQGRQKVISYKVHKRTSVPEKEWFIVEDAVPAIIDKDIFQAAQNLHRQDTRTAPGRQEVYLFSGLIRCADCGKGMARHTSRNLVYYQCRTNRDKSKARCTRHSIRLDILEKAVLAAVQTQIAFADSIPEIIAGLDRAPAAQRESQRLKGLSEQRERELEKTAEVLDGLYMDWKSGDITRSQYRRMKVRLEEQARRLQETIAHIQSERRAASSGPDDPCLTAFLQYGNIQHLSRSLLTELVSAVYVHEDKSIDIACDFADPYRRIVQQMVAYKRLSPLALRAPQEPLAQPEQPALPVPPAQ